jgi:hypothetical protein
MTRDAALLAVLVLAFAALATLHVALAVGLLARRPRWHGALALVLPPLAPYWGARQGMRARAIAWVVLAVVYAAALLVAYRQG